MRTTYNAYNTTQKEIDVCLCCPLSECIPDSRSCRLKGTARPKRTHAETLELDSKVKAMIYAGWCVDALIRELGITKSDYYSSRKRLLSRGEITDGRI